MSSSPDRLALLRMQEARRQSQRQLDLIDRQIMRRMTALIPELTPRRASYPRGRAQDQSAFLKRYRSHLAAITAQRQRKSTHCSASSRCRMPRSRRTAFATGFSPIGSMLAVRAIGPALLCNHAAVGIAIPWMTTRAPFERLLRIARSSTGQSCRVANFILAWWGRRQPRRVRLVRHLHCGSQHARNMATVVHRLFRISSRGISGAYRAEREDLIRVWRLEVSTRTVGIA